ncbi:MAG TPA: hypothetical protein PK141_01295 [Polyangiaceae bacterium]|nr:hypothetical protein [Polyangiaceae bacterium]
MLLTTMTSGDERRALQALERLRRIGVDEARGALAAAERARDEALEAHGEARDLARRERGLRDAELRTESEGARGRERLRAAELGALAAFREARDAGLEALHRAEREHAEAAARAATAAETARAELGTKQGEHQALVGRLASLDADARRRRDRADDDEASDLHAARRA